MSKKGKLIAVLAGVLAAAGVSGGIWYARDSVSRKEVPVYPVSMAGYTFDSDMETISGEVTDSAVQEVKKSGGLVDSVKVKVGKRVKKGDVLLQYNRESVKLAVQADEASIALIRAQIESANAEISRLQSLRTSEEMPEPTEQVIHHKAEPVSVLSSVDENTRPSEEENVYYCTPETKVTAAMLQKLDDTDQTAEFRMFENNVEIGSWQVDGAVMTSGEKTVYIIREKEEPDQPEPSDPVNSGTEPDPDSEEPGNEPGPENPDPAPGEPDPEPQPDPQPEPASPGTDGVRETRKEETAPYEDWILGNGVEFGGDGTVTVDYSIKHYGSLTSVVPEEAEWDEVVVIDPSVDTAGDNYAYSRKELAEAVQEKQKEIRENEMSLKEAELKLKEDQLVSSDGKVKAAMDGIVSEVKSFDEVKEGETLIKVKGDAGFTVTAYFSEYDVRNLQKGDVLQVNTYESGSSFTAEITDISLEPSDANMGSSRNLTYYPVTAAALDQDIELQRGEYCQIQKTQDTEAAGNICLDQMFIRKDAQGSYCMIADENNLLKKVYIETGRSQWGMMEILDGITEEDRIAFPYGKSVQEGSPVVDKENWYE